MKSTLRLFTILIFSIISFSGFAQMPGLNFKIPYGNNAKVGKYADVNGIKMYYEEYGKGEPLIVIHGNGSQIHDMGYQIEYFSKNYRVIAADSRAHGKSGVGNVPLTYDLMADDWAALLNTLHIDSVYVIGWSDGGILGLLLTIHHPEKVKKLATMGANLQPDSSAVYGWAVRIVANLDKQVDVKIANKDTTAPWSLLKMYLNLLGKQPNIPVNDLKKISAPSLILCADKDVITLEHTDEIFENIPHAQLCVFPGATHFIPVEDPELFNSTVGKFFRDPFTRPDTRTHLEKMKIE